MKVQQVYGGTPNKISILYERTLKNYRNILCKKWKPKYSLGRTSAIDSINCLFSGENLTLAGSGTIASKNVANGQSITLGSIVLANGNAAASNYNLASATLNINPRPLN